MADQDEGTQNQDGAVATAPDPSADANPTGSKSEQPKDPGKVDTGAEGEEGKPGSDDGGHGASRKEDERSRPSRAERRISELDKLAKENEKRANDLEQENAMLRDKLKDPIKAADIRLPDYSQQDNVTPEQLKQDIVNAADQIVKLRMEQYIPANNKEMTVRQYRERAYEDMQSAVRRRPELDPDNEKFEPELDQFLAKTFKRVFDADPSYRFRDLITDVFKQREGRGQNNTKEDAGTKKEDAHSKTALRQTGGSAKAHKPIADMTADEYKDYLRSEHR